MDGAPSLDSSRRRSSVLRDREGHRRLSFTKRRVRQRFEWTSRAGCRRAQHMGIDHRRADVAVSQQFLHATNINARVEQMRGE